MQGIIGGDLCVERVVGEAHVDRARPDRYVRDIMGAVAVPHTENTRYASLRALMCREIQQSMGMNWHGINIQYLMIVHTRILQQIGAREPSPRESSTARQKTAREHHARKPGRLDDVSLFALLRRLCGRQNGDRG